MLLYYIYMYASSLLLHSENVPPSCVLFIFLLDCFQMEFVWINGGVRERNFMELGKFCTVNNRSVFINTKFLDLWTMTGEECAKRSRMQLNWKKKMLLSDRNNCRQRELITSPKCTMMSQKQSKLRYNSTIFIHSRSSDDNDSSYCNYFRVYRRSQKNWNPYGLQPPLRKLTNTLPPLQKNIRTGWVLQLIPTDFVNQMFYDLYNLFYSV